MSAILNYILQLTVISVGSITDYLPLVQWYGMSYHRFVPYVSVPQVYSSPAPSSAVPDWTPHMDLDLFHHLAMPTVVN